MTLEDTKRILVGEWVSVTPEVRPSATRNPDGTLKPFYLSREFKYLGDDRFELTISNWADPYGKVAVARIDLRGHIEWVGEHPIASGAQKANFIADGTVKGPPFHTDVVRIETTLACCLASIQRLPAASVT